MCSSNISDKISEIGDGISTISEILSCCDDSLPDVHASASNLRIRCHLVYLHFVAL